MKLTPGPLPSIPTNATGMERVLSLPFGTDLLWRYPLGFPAVPPQFQQAPSSPLLDYKSQLPNSLASDPRVWSREDVSTFLRWAEREYDLQPFDMDMFQMNGKAMCLLTRTDLSERAPGSGDVLYNVLQLLVREANLIQRCLPSSPVTPTTRHPYPLSPHTHPPTPNWNILAQNSSETSFHPTHAATIAHLMAQSNSVTLSPAPSVDSQAGSPQQMENAQQNLYGHSAFTNGNTNGSNGSGSGCGSNPSDSDEDFPDIKNAQNTSPPNTPSYMLPPHLSYSLVPPKSPKEALSSPAFTKREFFPNESPEPNTNGRLLWDFLQQLLNDSNQRYTTFIAWKNRETGVFKIVDPPGLAKLWGIQKNHLSMNYDKMSRALRYYYRVNILRKVQGERHCYQFLRNPTELKNIKHINALRQQISPTRPSPPTPILNHHITIKPEPAEAPDVDIRNSQQEFRNSQQEFDEKPTDLSMDGPTDLSSNSTRQHVSIVCSPDTPTPTPTPREPPSQHFFSTMKEEEK